MRKWIQLVEGVGSVGLNLLANSRDEWLSSMQRVADIDSIRAALEDDESDEEDLIETWFDSRIGMFKHIEAKGTVPIYRNMRVHDFRKFIDGLEKGTNTLGNHWSLTPIESPTWDQDHDGELPITIYGSIGADAIDWDQTMRQQFEWPHELEVIFNGPVAVEQIINDDDDSIYNAHGARYQK